MAKTIGLSSLNEEQKINILISLANGATLREIKEYYNVDRKVVYALMGIKKYNMIIKERQKAVENTINRAFSKVDDKYIQIVDKYMDRLLNDERIDKTSNTALASIIESLSMNYKRVAEIKSLSHKTKLEAKRYQIEKKQAELAMAQRYNIDKEGQANPIINDFYEQLKGYATPISKLEADYGEDIDAYGGYKEDSRLLINKASEANTEIRRLNYELYKIDSQKYPMNEKELARAIKDEQKRNQANKEKTDTKE